MSRLAFADLLLRDAALVIVKATVVLALASAAAVTAKRFSAARRHMLWLAALSSCVWLVLSSLVVPAITIHTPMLAQEVVGTAAPPAAVAPNEGDDLFANTSRVPQQLPGTHAVRRSTLASMPSSSHPLIVLWIVGCVALLARHAAGSVGAMRLTRRASVATDDDTAREFAGAAAAVGLTRRVRLVYSPEVQAPFTFGVATPFVLLPSEARSWPSGRRRAVLAHEAAHVARGDWLGQAVGRLACALFWFHPLVWRAFAHLRDEAERAADDCVLRSGMPAFEYTTHLLELARRASDARPNPVAIGIVSSNDLERRFVAMFDARRSRTPVTSRARVVTASVALAIVCPLASIRVAAPAPPTTAPRLPAPSQPPSPARRAVARSANDLRPSTGERDAARVVRTPDVGATIVGERASETSEKSHASIAVVDHPAPHPATHPELSGTWRQDTVAGAMVDFFVTDSTIIRQSENAISFESRGHALYAPTYSGFQTLTFDGAESTGVVATGNVGANVRAGAVWVGDTLVLTTHSLPGAREFRTVERMTLSADGAVLSNTNLGFVNGKPLRGGPHTFVLRRISP